MREETRRRIASVVKRIPVREPFSLAGLCEDVGQVAGVAITLIADDTLPARCRGRFQHDAAGVTVSYNRNDPPWTQVLTVCHELIHVIEGHGRHRYFGDFDPRKVDIMIERGNAPATHITPDALEEEEVAEYGGQLLHERIAPRIYITTAQDPQAAGVFQRVVALLGLK